MNFVINVAASYAYVCAISSCDLEVGCSVTSCLCLGQSNHLKYTPVIAWTACSLVIYCQRYYWILSGLFKDYSSVVTPPTGVTTWRSLWKVTCADFRRMRNPRLHDFQADCRLPKNQQKNAQTFTNVHLIHIWSEWSTKANVSTL